MEKRYDFLNFQDRVNLYLDKELAQDDATNLLKEISANPECNRVYKKEKDYRTFVQQNIKRPSVSPQFISSIKKNIGL